MTLRDVDAPTTADEIAGEFRGLISSGRLIAGDRLPPVRQVARDLGVAAGTAARAYRALEEDGLVVTHRGGGTRVAPGAHALPPDVLDAIRRLDRTLRAREVPLESALDALRALARADRSG